MDTQQPEPTNPPRSRLESEVLEILERTDSEPGRVVQFKSRAQRERSIKAREVQVKLQNFRVNSLQLLASCLALAIVASVIDHSSPLAAKFFALASIGCLVMAFVVSFRQPKETSIKRWRGRDIDLKPMSSPEWWNRLRGPKLPKR